LAAGLLQHASSALVCCVSRLLCSLSSSQSFFSLTVRFVSAVFSGSRLGQGLLSRGHCGISLLRNAFLLFLGHAGTTGSQNGRQQHRSKSNLTNHEIIPRSI